jgi:hypothetical protein
MSEHNNSFVGCMSPTINRIKSLLRDCASGVFKYYKTKFKFIKKKIKNKNKLLYFGTILDIVYDDQIELRK